MTNTTRISGVASVLRANSDNLPPLPLPLLLLHVPPLPSPLATRNSEMDHTLTMLISIAITLHGKRLGNFCDFIKHVW